MKYTMNNNTANNKNFFNNLFNKYFSISPFYEKEKSYKVKDSFKTGYFTYLVNEAHNKPTRKSPLFSASYSPNDEDLTNLWCKFVPKLDTYYALAPKSFDYYIGDTPVKIHGNYIQIGSTLIPKFADTSYFSAISNESKTIIYKVIINIDTTFIG